jgi:hypothetical protein
MFCCRSSKPFADSDTNCLPNEIPSACRGRWVSKMIDYKLEDWVRYHSRIWIFFSPQLSDPLWSPHSLLPDVDPGDSFLGTKLSGSWRWPLWRYAWTLYAFMAWRVIKPQWQLLSSNFFRKFKVRYFILVLWIVSYSLLPTFVYQLIFLLPFYTVCHFENNPALFLVYFDTIYALQRSHNKGGASGAQAPGVERVGAQN